MTEAIYIGAVAMALLIGYAVGRVHQTRTTDKLKDELMDKVMDLKILNAKHMKDNIKNHRRNKQSRQIAVQIEDLKEFLQ